MNPGDSGKITAQARQIVYRLLKIRLRSEQEIRSRLRLKKIPETTADDVVAYFKELGLIDDRVFARKWIAYRQSKPYGRSRIRFELRNKGIQEDILNEELRQGYEDFSEEQVVCDLAERRAQKYDNIDPEKRRKRIYDYLQRRGFAPNTIIKALKHYDSQRNPQ